MILICFIQIVGCGDGDPLYHLDLDSGSYFLSVGGLDSSSFGEYNLSITKSGELSIKNNSESSFDIQLYPNPVSDIINLSRTKPGGIEKYEILSLDGRRVIDVSFKSGKSNVEYLSSGVYLLRIINLEEKSVSILKFIKTK